MGTVIVYTCIYLYIQRRYCEDMKTFGVTAMTGSIVLDRWVKGLCPICAKPLAKEYKSVEYRGLFMYEVLVCKKHYTGGEK